MLCDVFAGDNSVGKIERVSVFAVGEQRVAVLTSLFLDYLVKLVGFGDVEH